MKKIIGICILVFCLSFIFAEPLYLSKMNVVTDNNWKPGEKTYVYVYTMDANETLVDVNQINIELLNNISFEQQRKIYRTDIGTYKKYFMINESVNVSVLYFNITAIEKVKSINQVINITLVQENGVKKIYSTTKKYVVNTWVMFKDGIFEYWLPLIILVCSFLVIIVFIDLFFRRKP